MRKLRLILCLLGMHKVDDTKWEEYSVDYCDEGTEVFEENGDQNKCIFCGHRVVKDCSNKTDYKD